MRLIDETELVTDGRLTVSKALVKNASNCRCTKIIRQIQIVYDKREINALAHSIRSISHDFLQLSQLVSLFILYIRDMWLNPGSILKLAREKPATPLNNPSGVLPLTIPPTTILPVVVMLILPGLSIRIFFTTNQPVESRAGKNVLQLVSQGFVKSAFNVN